MARKSGPSKEPERPKLLVNKSEAKEKLLARIVQGNELTKARASWNFDLLDQVEAEYYRWDTYNGKLLRSLFTTNEHQDEYNSRFGMCIDEGTLDELVESLLTRIQNAVAKIQYVYDEIDLIPLDPNVAPSTPVVSIAKGIPVSTKKDSTKVFVVHGHDDAAKFEVANFLHKIKLEPIILHQQLNKGKTIIEKFEDNSDVAFAVILLTPDDVGAAKAAFDVKKDDALALRARENVVFEMGFFFAKLGRKNVCALVKGETKGPSDISGLVYQPMDIGGGWKAELGREMKAAGLPVDLNLV